MTILGTNYVVKMQNDLVLTDPSTGYDSPLGLLSCNQLTIAESNAVSEA